MSVFRPMSSALIALCMAITALAAPPVAAQTPASLPAAVSTEAAAGRPAVEASDKNRELEDRPIRVRPGGAGVRRGAAAASNRPTSSLWLWLQTAGILAVVLAAMWLVLKWLRKAGFGGTFGGSNAAVQVVSRGYLSSKHQMVLVRFGGRVLLVGVAPQNVSVLSEITDPAEVAQVLARSESAKDTSASREFEQVIREASAEYDQTAATAAVEVPPAAPAPEQIRSLRTEIRGLLDKMQSLHGRKPAE